MPEYQYDIAISFAHPEREIARRLAEILKVHDVRVFYDEFEQANLLGKDLAIYLDEIFQRKAMFCVILMSKVYVERPWARYELSSALARAIHEKRDYIIPIKVDDCDLPGVHRNIVHLKIKEYSLEEIGRVLIQKLIMETKAAVEEEHVEIEENGNSKIKLTPEDPHDSQEFMTFWNNFSSEPEQLTINNRECAWVIPWRGGGRSISERRTSGTYLSYLNNFAGRDGGPKAF